MPVGADEARRIHFAFWLRIQLMQKISDSTNTANPAGEFTEGNPAAGVPATLLKAPWLNAIQRERAALLLGAGINLNASDDSQVLKAVKALASVAADFNKLTNKPTTLGGYGITDAFTKPEATSAIQQAISNLVASSPAALDTLKELASALGNDPNFATTMTNALAGKASKATTLGGYGITDAFTKPETSAAIQQAIAALVASSPAALDTLKELADALGNDPNFATTMTNALAGKASKATTLGGYGISDAYTKTEITGFLNSKLNSSFCANAGFTDSTAAQPFMTHSNGITVGLARQDAALGVAQTWQDVKASRAANTNYTNTTGRPIQVNITTADANARSLTVGGVVAGYTNSTYGGNYFLTAIVPPGSTYSYSGTFSNWAELRS